MAKFHSSGLVWCRKWNARAAPALTGTGIRHQRLDMPFLTANEYRSSLRTSSTNRLSISSGVRVRMRDDLLAHFQHRDSCLHGGYTKGKLLTDVFRSWLNIPKAKVYYPPPDITGSWRQRRGNNRLNPCDTGLHKLISTATRPGRLFVKQKKDSAGRGKNYTCRQ